MNKHITPNNLAHKWHKIMELDDLLISKEIRPFGSKNSTQEQSSKQQNQENKMSLSEKISNESQNIDELKEAIIGFDGCGLKRTATNTVFSDGTLGAPVMMIGEAPGASEDEKGIPFCGDSGKLLDNIISSINLSREKNVYISNTIFWRPPANRRPTEEEIEICRPFVEKHIALAKPKLLILVGATAVSALLGKNLQISKIRQEYYQYKNKYLDDPITTTAIFHPAYLLRQPYQKRSMWYDLLKIKDFLDNI